MENQKLVTAAQAGVQAPPILPSPQSGEGDTGFRRDDLFRMLCTSSFVVSLSNHERTQSLALSGSCRSPFDAAQGERGPIHSFL